MPGDLSELIEKLEKATGPDQQLDRAIQAYVAEHIDRWPWKDIGPDAFGQNASRVLTPPNLPKDFAYPPKGAVHPWYHVPDKAVTESIDAALALVDRLLPSGVMLNIGSTKSARLWVVTPRGMPPGAGHFEAEARTPALALILALLKAMEAQHAR